MLHYGIHYRSPELQLWFHWETEYGSRTPGYTHYQYLCNSMFLLIPRRAMV